jgi:hypothetical protein
MISTHEAATAVALSSGLPTPAQETLFLQPRPPRSAVRAGEAVDERSLGDGCEEKIAWTHEEVVMLHGILFDTCVEQLGDPETPLDEVIDCLRWIFSGPNREARAFSFATTLKLYQRAHACNVREAIQVGLKRYLSERLARYPAWVAEAFWSDPDRFAEELERNPQWINERVRRVAHDGDLFAA